MSSATTWPRGGTIASCGTSTGSIPSRLSTGGRRSHISRRLRRRERNTSPLGARPDAEAVAHPVVRRGVRSHARVRHRLPRIRRHEPRLDAGVSVALRRLLDVEGAAPLREHPRIRQGARQHRAAPRRALEGEGADRCASGRPHAPALGAGQHRRGRRAGLRQPRMGHAHRPQRLRCDARGRSVRAAGEPQVRALPSRQPR